MGNLFFISTTLKRQGHKAHFSVIEPTLFYVTTDRSVLQARERDRERDLIAPCSCFCHVTPCPIILGCCHRRRGNEMP